MERVDDSECVSGRVEIKSSDCWYALSAGWELVTTAGWRLAGTTPPLTWALTHLSVSVQTWFTHQHHHINTKTDHHQIMWTRLSCVLLIIIQITHQLVIEEKDGAAQLTGSYDLTRYPHYNLIKNTLLARSGSIDIKTYLNGRNGNGESNALTDLPEDLQQLQQQLLEVSIKIKVFTNKIFRQTCQADIRKSYTFISIYDTAFIT